MFAVLLSRSVALAVPLDGSRPLFLEWTGCLRDGCTPFDDERGLAPSALVLTAGYVFSAATLAPLGFVSLRENMLAQKFSFVLLIVLCAIFLGSFGFTLGDGAVAAVGPKSWDVLGVVIFNFAFCVTVPSWLNEKADHVDETPVIWAACLSTGVGYVVFGWLGAGRETGAKCPTSKAPSSTVFHSFRLILGRAIIPRSALEAWVLSPEQSRAEHPH